MTCMYAEYILLGKLNNCWAAAIWLHIHIHEPFGKCTFIMSFSCRRSSHTGQACCPKTPPGGSSKTRAIITTDQQSIKLRSSNRQTAVVCKSRMCKQQMHLSQHIGYITISIHQGYGSRSRPNRLTRVRRIYHSIGTSIVPIRSDKTWEQHHALHLKHPIC